MISITLFTINVITRWSVYLHALAHDVQNMSSDTLMYMRENPFAKAELVRRGELEDDDDNADAYIPDTMDDEDRLYDFLDDDFLPFGEDGRLPKRIRSHWFVEEDM